jgi:hypothetical protein
MTIWFISPPSSALPATDASDDFAFDAAGLPDLSRAESQEYLKEWLRVALPKAVPEHLSAFADYLWTLSHAMSENDYVLVQHEGTEFYQLGEVRDAYHYDSVNKRHALGMQWINGHLEATKAPQFAAHFKPGSALEITDLDVITKLHRHIPAKRRIGPTIFRWVALATLVSELIYFWPR